MDYNQQAARDAHHYLTRRVRNDWAFPAVPLPASASDEDLHGVAEFRERYYGTTSASATPEPEPSPDAAAYKFNSPDCVGVVQQDEGERRREARKRKRRRVLEEEMQWNEGMVCFVRRRDAWTGATSVRKYARRRSRTAATAAEPLVPLAAPLLAQNPIRQSITPRVYPDIYSKIVVASQTPKVPINLADMTRALVQGWKDDGEWPPRPAPLDPLMGRKREAGAAKGIAGMKHGQDFLAQHPHVKRGVDSVKRVFRLSSSGSAGVAQEQGTPPIV
ncbi:hypothetical protein K490DRAFT_35701 [Saccharata proteae CBS 121410]|uniref:Gag1-like clamp domain-containing protein n=1 Tax=Saccharata proteae CBS 121410 TaxID=1314787 RepID=A0A9P4I189_9PEZI|nr:hypothetical protein K490DRAFT_35701 [Saccharata proteae CBS 121410]